VTNPLWAGPGVLAPALLPSPVLQDASGILIQRRSKAGRPTPPGPPRSGCCGQRCSGCQEWRKDFREGFTRIIDMGERTMRE